MLGHLLKFIGLIAVFGTLEFFGPIGHVISLALTVWILWTFTK